MRVLRSVRVFPDGELEAGPGTDRFGQVGALAVHCAQHLLRVSVCGVGWGWWRAQPSHAAADRRIACREQEKHEFLTSPDWKNAALFCRRCRSHTTASRMPAAETTTTATTTTGRPTTDYSMLTIQGPYRSRFKSADPCLSNSNSGAPSHLALVVSNSTQEHRTPSQHRGAVQLGADDTVRQQLRQRLGQWKFSGERRRRRRQDHAVGRQQ